MSPLRRIVKSLLPAPLRRRLKAAHREMIFRRGMRHFLADPEGSARPGSPVLSDLVYGWGNTGFSAKDHYLADCIAHASTTSDAILECGSGLSTILVGVISSKRGVPHWTLEHDGAWADRTRGYLRRYGLGVELRVAPLADHGDFVWYAPPLDAMPKRFSLVVCDGPPGHLKGGRYGLVPVMRERLAPGCVILLDDAGRQDESAIARRWESELGASVRMRGTTKQHVAMTLPESRSA